MGVLAHVPKANEANLILSTLNINLRQKFYFRKDKGHCMVKNVRKPLNLKFFLFLTFKLKLIFFQCFHRKLVPFILIAVGLSYTCSEKKMKALISTG